MSPMVEREAISQHRLDPTPEAVGDESLSYLYPPRVHHGREAVVAEVVNQQGNTFALKWYDSLQGKSVDELINYARCVKQDETGLLDVGLTEDQVPQSHFFIASQPDGIPRLYALQAWAEGKRLKEFSALEVIRNKELSSSLAKLILKSHEFYKLTGHVPDLSGGDRLNIFGKLVPDPRKNIWPLRSANIIVSEDTAVLPDAKTCVIIPGTIKYAGVMLHHYLSVYFARVLNRIHG